MEDFPSNRRDVKPNRKVEGEPEQKKIARVTQGEVVRRKKPLGKRFAETFGAGDARGVWAYVMMDVLIPAAKDMVADAVSQGFERMLFGEVRSTSRRIGHKPGGYTPYNRYSSPSHSRRDTYDEPRRELSRRSRATHDFDEIILQTRVEAEEVIDRLFDLVSRYEVATVADLYELLGISGSYTDDRWGWSDIRGADIRRVRNGYLLDLPKPEPLD